MDRYRPDEGGMGMRREMSSSRQGYHSNRGKFSNFGDSRVPHSHGAGGYGDQYAQYNTSQNEYKRYGDAEYNQHYYPSRPLSMSRNDQSTTH